MKQEEINRVNKLQEDFIKQNGIKYIHRDGLVHSEPEELKQNEWFPLGKHGDGYDSELMKYIRG